MSYAAEVTSDLALWVAGWVREMLADAPPPSQRSTSEWLLERMDEAASDQGVAAVQPVFVRDGPFLSLETLPDVLPQVEPS
jgi:hypothetical protein